MPDFNDPGPLYDRWEFSLPTSDETLRFAAIGRLDANAYLKSVLSKALVQNPLAWLDLSTQRILTSENPSREIYELTEIHSVLDSEKGLRRQLLEAMVIFTNDPERNRMLQSPEVSRFLQTVKTALD